MHPTPRQDELRSYPVWDLPVRISHWLIGLLCVWQFLSGHFGWFPTVHLWAGYGMLAVIAFRLQWGLIGSDSARWLSLFARLRRLPAGLADLPRRSPGFAAGHNPVGALSVLLMVALLLTESVTGLFFESWGEVRGPLAERVARDTAVWLSDLHGLLRWPTAALVVVHVAAGIHHLVWKGENRLGAIFLHGRLTLPADPNLRRAGVTPAVLAAAVSLALVGAIAWMGPIA